MTSSYVTPLRFAGEQTFAVPPSWPAAQQAIKVIFLATALGVTPTSANAAGMREGGGEARRLENQWTNSGGLPAESPGERAFAAAVLEVRRRSGLTWEQLASLFDVDRRSVHLWASGRPMSAPNAERLNRVLVAVRRADRGSPSATRAWLHSPTSQGILPLDLLREGRFDEVVALGAEVNVPRPAPLSETARAARAPLSPADLVSARQDRVHIETGKLIAAVPFKASKPK
jgi:transcriptional regulator with XRE-family HTH domain